MLSNAVHTDADYVFRSNLTVSIIYIMTNFFAAQLNYNFQFQVCQTSTNILLLN